VNLALDHHALPASVPVTSSAQAQSVLVLILRLANNVALMAVIVLAQILAAVEVW
jgi:hypothetical protein